MSEQAETRTSARSLAAVLSLLAVGVLLAACSGPEPEAVPESSPASVQQEPSDAGEAQPSDGGGDDAEENSPSATAAADTAWCEVPEHDLIVLRSDESTSCGEVEEIFADADTWDYPTGEGEEDPSQWYCAIASGQVPTPSVFTEVLQCARGDSQLTALPADSVPLDGFAVDMSTYAAMSGDAANYAFSVPGSDLICSIVPSTEGERGHLGCHGTFEADAEAEGPDGLEPANTVELDSAGASFSAFGDPAYHPIGPDGGFMSDVSELPTDAVLSAYGVVCQSLEDGALACTAGPDAAMTVSATAHEFTP